MKQRRRHTARDNLLGLRWEIEVADGVKRIEAIERYLVLYFPFLRISPRDTTIVYSALKIAMLLKDTLGYARTQCRINMAH